MVTKTLVVTVVFILSIIFPISQNIPSRNYGTEWFCYDVNMDFYNDGVHETVCAENGKTIPIPLVSNVEYEVSQYAKVGWLIKAAKCGNVEDQITDLSKRSITFRPIKQEDPLCIFENVRWGSK